jgi:vitamin B12/bleomycin/antimicrobial peptide transport system ATP-binding/permease protein
MSKQQQYKLDALYFQRLGKLLRPYWTSRAHWRGWLAMTVLVTMVPVAGVLYLHVTKLSGAVTNALLAHNKPLFSHLLLLSVVQALAGTAIGVVQMLVDGWLAIDWRRVLTLHLTDQYLARRNYYHILSTESVDNPDQRIQMEVTPFCETFAFLPREFLSGLVNMGLQVGLLYHTSQLLFWCTIGFALTRLAMTLFLYTPTIRLNYDIKVKEADLRFGLLQVREHGESVAFYRGEGAERRQIFTRLQTTLRANWNLVRYNGFLFSALGLVGVIWNLLPNAILGPLYLSHHIDYGSISVATAAAATLLMSFAVIEDFIPFLAVAAPAVVRLAQISEAYEDLEHAPVATAAAPRITFSSGPYILIKNLTLCTPGGERALVSNLNLAVHEGESITVTGMTGVGKSSLLRALAGLWTRGEGEIMLPAPDQMTFMPQKPYVMLGSLHDQMTYPWGSTRRQDSARLQSVLDRVGLGHLTERFGGFNAVENWAQKLSLGEQQRLGFCRVLLNPARFVMLDEATSAVDVTTEAHLYDLLRRQGCAYISICHRPSAIAFHQRVLELQNGGAWEIREQAGAACSLAAGVSAP